MALSTLFAVLTLLALQQSGFSEAPAPVEIHNQIITAISDALAESRKETGRQLSALGFEQQIREIQLLDDHPIQSFSPQTMVETLYRRAEAGKKGDGDRFLALLHNEAAKSSAAIARDPDFKTLGQYTPKQLKEPFNFAPLPAGKQTPLKPAAAKAVGVLSEHLSGGHLAKVNGLFLRVLQAKGFNQSQFERVLAESKSTPEAIERLLEVGTPPLAKERALLEIMIETHAKSASFAVDPQVLAVMDELSQELPAEIERYRDVEDTIPSRVAQAAEAASIGERGKASKEPIIAMWNNRRDTGSASSPGGGGDGPDIGGAGGGKGSSKGYSGDIYRGGPGGGAGQHARAYSSYTSSTFGSTSASSMPSGVGRVAPATPRSYRSAIISARAARGIALGGTVSSEINPLPLRAIWYPNAKDNRWGRLFLEFPDKDGKKVIAASRVLFADSFYASAEVLWGKHDDEATYRDGNILVLMSMVPDSLIKKEGAEAIEKQLEKLRSDAAANNKSDAELYQELRNLIANGKNLQRTRGVVTHPALFGRELAWSAVRVDFSFNNIDGLSKEAALMNGGKSMPEAVTTSVEGADTWQFYELDSVIQLGTEQGKAQTLKVISKPSGKESNRSHFAISMFSIPESDGDGPADAKAKRLPELEGKIQPMLDWLSTNHHDFIRLNDFSEAFSLLRWLKSKDIQVVTINLSGQLAPLATPDRVIIGKGPGVKHNTNSK
ncbi:hypothetical protein [Methylocystis sp.]|uniref:hypothetical protein n=1 Tax=Methylocystis sp. TaxID=1911079 RepID=UPI0025FF210F|nr:hypothetical protein [Methylocystis sp.]